MAATALQPFEYVPVDHDEKVLLSLGYRQEFRREFSLWTTFCVSFAILGLLPSFASTLYYGMGYAGTAGVCYFFFFFFFFFIILFVVVVLIVGVFILSIFPGVFGGC